MLDGLIRNSIIFRAVKANESDYEAYFWVRHFNIV